MLWKHQLEVYSLNQHSSCLENRMVNMVYCYYSEVERQISYDDIVIWMLCISSLNKYNYFRASCLAFIRGILWKSGERGVVQVINHLPKRGLGRTCFQYTQGLTQPKDRKGHPPLCEQTALWPTRGSLHIPQPPPPSDQMSTHLSLWSIHSHYSLAWLARTVTHCHTAMDDTAPVLLPHLNNREGGSQFACPQNHT